MQNALAHFDLPGTLLLLVFVLAVFYLVVVRKLQLKSNLRNLPLTPAHAFSGKDDPFKSYANPVSAPSHQLKLSGEGLKVCILASIFGLVGAGLTYWIVNSSLRDELYRKEGVDTSAVVTNASEIRQRRGRRRVRVEYNYQVGEKLFHGRDDVSGNRRKPETNARIAIRYLASQPEISRLADHQSLPLPLAFSAIALFLVPGVIFGLALLRDRKLVLEGRSTTGIVIGTVSQGKYGRQVYYDFKTATGAVIRGNSIASRSTISDGDWLPILYLPNQPERNSLAVSLSWRIDGPSFPS